MRGFRNRDTPHRTLRAVGAVLLFSAMVAIGSAPASPAQASEGRVKIPTSTFHPPYPMSPEEEVVQVPAFELDKHPVTNEAFLAFVKANPDWRRGNTPGVYADERYLSHWAGPTTLGEGVDPLQPVTRVSWFAARAYCRAAGGRLPNEHEWELVALANETKADASKDAVYLQQILAWYAQPTPKVLPKVGQNPPNVHGVYDMHGLVWEWVGDFGMSMVSSDSREGGSLDEARFCGGTAITQGDKEDYARFMRYAYRSSLNAAFTVGNLGFRCAKDGN